MWVPRLSCLYYALFVVGSVAVLVVSTCVSACVSTCVSDRVFKPIGRRIAEGAGIRITQCDRGMALVHSADRSEPVQHRVSGPPAAIAVAFLYVPQRGGLRAALTYLSRQRGLHDFTGHCTVERHLVENGEPAQPCQPATMRVVSPMANNSSSIRYCGRYSITRMTRARASKRSLPRSMRNFNSSPTSNKNAHRTATVSPLSSSIVNNSAPCAPLSSSTNARGPGAGGGVVAGRAMSTP